MYFCIILHIYEVLRPSARTNKSILHTKLAPLLCFKIFAIEVNAFFEE